MIDDELFRVDQGPQQVASTGNWGLGLSQELLRGRDFIVAGQPTERAEVRGLDHIFCREAGKLGRSRCIVLVFSIDDGCRHSGVQVEIADGMNDNEATSGAAP